MDIPLVLQITEIIVATSALAYGFFEYYRRQKIEKVLKAISHTYPGDVAKIEQSCVWGWANVKNAHEMAIKIPDCAEKQQILRMLNMATSDTGASARMCALLFNQLLGFQEGQFDTRIISHPEKDVLDLCKAEARNSNASLL